MITRVQRSAWSHPRKSIGDIALSSLFEPKVHSLFFDSVNKSAGHPEHLGSDRDRRLVQVDPKSRHLRNSIGDARQAATRWISDKPDVRASRASYLAFQCGWCWRVLITVLAIWEHFPKTPPYGGKWPDMVPHVSVAWLPDEQQLDGVIHDFTGVAREKLPIQAIAAQVVLVDDSSGRSEIHAIFGLG